MIVAVTATLKGVTPKQVLEACAFLIEVGATELHHGDAIGGDEQMHLLAEAMRIRRVVHPSNLPDKRAFCRNADEVREVKDPIERNHDMVDESDLLLVLPRSAREEKRSGTWATARYGLVALGSERVKVVVP